MTAIAAAEPRGRAGFMDAWRDSSTEALRHLRIIPRNPELLGFSLVQPIMFVLLFVYVFGGAIQVPGFSNYNQFLIPGIFAQTLVFGSSFTAVGLAEDLSKGLVDRLRSLPIARSAVLVGRTFSDLARNVFDVLRDVVVAFLVGFRFEGSLLGAIGGTALMMAFSYRLQLDPGLDRSRRRFGRSRQRCLVHLDVPDHVLVVRVRRPRNHARLAGADRRRTTPSPDSPSSPSPLQRLRPRGEPLVVDRLDRGHHRRLLDPGNHQVFPHLQVSAGAHGCSW